MEASVISTTAIKQGEALYKIHDDQALGEGQYGLIFKAIRKSDKQEFAAKRIKKCLQDWESEDELDFN